MGEGEKRIPKRAPPERRTSHDRGAPVRSSETDDPEDEPVDEEAATLPKVSLPLLSRTATVDDPLTTSLLAEVARRTRTVEVSPEQIAEAMDAESVDREGREGGDDPDAPFAPPVPPARPASSTGAPKTRTVKVPPKGHGKAPSSPARDRSDPSDDPADD